MDHAYGTTRNPHTQSLVEAIRFVTTDFNPLYNCCI